MGCRTCGSKGGHRFAKDIPIFDANGNRLADNLNKFKRLSKNRPKRTRIRKLPGKPNVVKNKYSNLVEIPFEGKRVNVLEYNPSGRCIFIVGYMEGCGSCNYMRRLINKLLTPEMRSKVTAYILDKRFTEPKGFHFTGNPTILFVDKGKLVFQVGGIYNKIRDKIVSYFMR
jgi:hypothetical protein